MLRCSDEQCGLMEFFIVRNSCSGEQCGPWASCITKVTETAYVFNVFEYLYVFIIPPANEVAGVYSDPYVHPFVRLFVRPSVPPSQSLIRYSSKTAEQNFMKLSGIVHYMMPYCTSYFKFLSA